MTRVVVIVVARSVVEVVAVPLDRSGVVIVVARVVVIVVMAATMSPAVARVNGMVAAMMTAAVMAHLMQATMRVANIDMNATSVEMKATTMAGFGLVSSENETKGDGCDSGEKLLVHLRVSSERARGRCRRGGDVSASSA